MALPQITVAAMDYVDAGLVLVPIQGHGKGPEGKDAIGWNTRERCIATAEAAGRVRGGKLGLAHAYCTPPTCALDVDDLQKALDTRDQHGVDVAALLMDPDAVQVRSGRANRAKLLYRLRRPMSTVQRADWGFELRCAAESGLTVQDVLPPSIHPDTGKPYELVGDIRKIPEIPVDLLQLWLKLEPAHRASPIEKIKSDDPVLKRLIERGMVRREMGGGKVAITCPFEEEHTTEGGESDVVYFLPHTGGYPNGHFHCLHAHCAQRPGADFLKAIGLTPSSPAASVEEIADWPRPDDILREFVAPPYTQLDVPAALGRYAEAFARAGGFDASLVILSCVVAAAAMLDDRIRLHLPGETGWRVPPILWGALIASSAAGKTPSIEAAMRPIRELHRELVQRWDRECAPLGEDDKRPPRPALYSSDATIEALADVLRANERGILVLPDEFEAWLGQHDAYRNNVASKDRGEWLNLFEGKSHQVDRIKRGSSFVPNWGASILTGSTPVALVKLARHLRADGLMQRFLIAIAKPMVAPEAEKHVDAHRQAYEACLRRLYGHGADTGAKTVTLGGEAARLFTSECRRLRELTQAIEPLSGALGAHLGKYPGLLARVALVFHAVACGEMHPSSRPVASETMGLGIRFMKRAGQHATVLYTSVFAEGSAMELARAVARSVLVSGAAEVTNRELIHRCHLYRKAAEFERAPALELLEAFKWVTPLAGAYEKARPTHWAVNPQVHERFARHAEEHRQRLELVRERLRSEPEDTEC